MTDQGLRSRISTVPMTPGIATSRIGHFISLRATAAGTLTAVSHAAVASTGSSRLLSLDTQVRIGVMKRRARKKQIEMLAAVSKAITATAFRWSPIGAE